MASAPGATPGNATRERAAATYQRQIGRSLAYATGSYQPRTLGVTLRFSF